MPGRTRKFAQLSPQKTRQSPAKFVKLTEHDDQEEKRIATASKIARGHERVKSIVIASSARRASGIHGSPSTPTRNSRDHGGPGTPVMKMPILANFEEWMKMATDNKINAGNSWNFALIDYFHEMSLLREGDSINFQKASVTLDGCVKIYTNRVDSVATETGKLLSGLSSSKEQHADGTEANEDGEDAADEDDEDGETRRTKRRAAKTSSGSTLVKDFSAIQAKKLDMEFFVDPLFKKTSAEFDEGGAKGLLLNHLCVDRQGRIIFDASDACNEIASGDSEEQPEYEEESSLSSTDLEALGQQFFPELFEDNDEAFENLHICPFLKNFQSDSTIFDIPLLVHPAAEDSPILDQGGFDDDNHDEPNHDAGFSGVVDVFDDNEDAGFGEVELNLPMHAAAPDAFGRTNGSHLIGKGTAVGSENYLGMNLDGENMYSQFDALMNKNWTGPANWKISRLQVNNAAAPAVKKPRKEKEVTMIDFESPDGEVDEDVIFASGGTSINLPKSQWSSKSRNLLPEDKHFNSESLLRLFLKPNIKIGTRKTIVASASGEDGADEGRFIDMDEKFWAQRTEEAQILDADSSPADAGAPYDANFFTDGEAMMPGGHTHDDDDDGDDHFEDANQEFSPPATQGGTDFASQLQTLDRRVKPEYVNYAKAAKKVDVRVLKENIWDKLQLPSLDDSKTTSSATTTNNEIDGTTPQKSGDGEVRKFTQIVQSLGDVYPTAAMSEISTSFCFICLLHLANEKGLEITTDAGMRDLTVRRDETVKSIEAV